MFAFTMAQQCTGDNDDADDDIIWFVQIDKAIVQIYKMALIILRVQHPQAGY